MPLDLDAISAAPRLLIEADLQPVQGTRFQPTGFPNLGHAVYDAPDVGRVVLVESAQSMANRLEVVCWNDVADDWVEPLKGLPLVKVVDTDGGPVTNSILEAHRLNSELIARSKEFSESVVSEIGYEKGKAFNSKSQLYPALLKFDPNSLIHGTFLEEIAGVIRLPRSLSAFVEAHECAVAPSGGVKISSVDPTLKKGEGNVIYARDEWTAERITAYFNLDLRQIRAFGLGPEAERLLIALALYKIVAFLEDGLRLRTACDLDLTETRVTRPEGFALPSRAELETELPGLIEAAAKKGLFADPPTTKVTWKESKKKGRGKGSGAGDTDSSEGGEDQD